MAGPAVTEFLRHLQALVDAGESCAVATVIDIDGSASARPGAKMIVNARGETVFGWVGGGCAESEVRDQALQALEEGRPRVIRLDLDDEVLGVGMPCGGHMSVYVEPVQPQPRLLVLGHGTIAETVAAMGSMLEFHVTVNDPLATPAAFPSADVRVTDDPDYAKAECDPETFVVITTQHKSDYEAMSRVLRQRPAYVGLVASRKRSALLLERLREDGFDLAQLRRVSAPSGLDIGGHTPQEIALSIVAEVLQARRGGNTSGRPLREIKGVDLDASGVEIRGSDASEIAGESDTSDRCPR